MHISVMTFKSEYPMRYILQDIHKQHTLIMKLFPSGMKEENPRSAHNILWRKENHNGKTVFIIQSDLKPTKSNIKEEKIYRNVNLETKDFQKRLELLLQEEKVAYKIVANPIKRNKKTTTPLTTPEEIHEWWNKRLEELGMATINDDIIIDLNEVETGNRRKQRVTINSATIVGRATIEDAVKLEQAIRNGVGREKSYGYGMLSLSKTYSGTAQ